MCGPVDAVPPTTSAFIAPPSPVPAFLRLPGRSIRPRHPRHRRRGRASKPAEECDVANALHALLAWLGLAWGTLTLPTTAPGEAANVALAGDFAYATRGKAGIEIVRLADGERRRIALAQGASADDVAVADGLLFVLDASPPGSLSVYSIADPSAPVLREPPIPVEVGPFSGVS